MTGAVRHGTWKGSRRQRAWSGSMPAVAHGTLGGYTNWSCDCPACTEAMRTYDAIRREKRRLTQDAEPAAQGDAG